MSKWISVDERLPEEPGEEQDEGCKYCTEYEDLPEHFIDGAPAGRVFDTDIDMDEFGRWHINVPVGSDIGIRFCPMCGRELKEG